MRTKETQTQALKITTQYRSKVGMVYELALGTASLDVHVWRENIEGNPSTWRVEAHDGHLPDAVVVGKSAATRGEALREVGQAWSTPDLGLPRFDWEAVATLLGTVRAL